MDTDTDERSQITVDSASDAELDTPAAPIVLISKEGCCARLTANSSFTWWQGLGSRWWCYYPCVIVFISQIMPLKISPLLGALKASWCSDVYNHYRICLVHNTSNGKCLWFEFICIHHSDTHPSYLWAWSKTSEGTSNLKSGMFACQMHHKDGGLVAGSAFSSSIAYSKTAHCAQSLCIVQRSTIPSTLF